MKETTMVRHFLFAAILLVASFQTSFAGQRDGWHDKFGSLAAQLVSGIEAKRVALKNDGDAFRYASPLKVALWPFDQKDLPIAETIARDFNGALLERLMAYGGQDMRFSARESLGVLIKDLESVAAGQDRISELLGATSEVDVLVVGTVRKSAGGVDISYKAVRRDGTILVQTKPAWLGLKRAQLSATAGNLTLSSAIEDAAESLARQTPELDVLYLDGVRFETSGAQPTFGRFVLEDVAGVLQRAGANPVTDKTVVVKPLSEKMGTGGYVLSGTYWEFDDAVHLRLSLATPDGAIAAWSGRITRDSVGTLALRPSLDYGALRENDGIGPFSFKLTANKGDDPVYSIGERLSLKLTLSRDAYAHCFYHQANGQVVQIFPNPYAKKFPLRGGRTYDLPSEEIFPFDFTLGAPIGEELVKCFATSRDVSADLPEELRGKSLDPLALLSVEGLSERFRSLANTEVTEASVSLTVVD